MGRSPSCGKIGFKRGPWTPEEDLRLTNYVKAHGEGRWRSLSKKADLLRSGKSCRMRWLNYLQPNVKRGHILPDEEELILRLHRLLGNRWSLIAGRLPGRTDNDIKNHWNSHLSKKLIKQGIDPRTHRPLSESEDIWWNPEESNMDQNILQALTTQETANNEIQDKDSEFMIESHKEDQIYSRVSPTMLSASSEIIANGEVGSSNCCETLKQGTYRNWFPCSLPATPMATTYENSSSYMHPSFLQPFINEEFDQLPDPSVEANSVARSCSHHSELACPRHDLWSTL